MIIFFILALITLVILMWIRVNNDADIYVFILHCFATIMVYCALVIYGCSPQAIDVYRGKTTLEITYKDSIPVDSVVVFKDK